MNFTESITFGMGFSIDVLLVSSIILALVFLLFALIVHQLPLGL